MAQATFREHRPLLVGIAYQMLGQITEAEDVVQDAWLRWSQVDAATIANPRAYLVRITSRLAIDRLRRAKARRETPCRCVRARMGRSRTTGRDIALRSNEFGTPGRSAADSPCTLVRAAPTTSPAGRARTRRVKRARATRG